MFQEIDCVTLTAPIPLENTWDIPDGSPLLDPARPGQGLLPGDVGTIICVQGAGEAFDVEFLEPNGYTVAIATVYPHQLRLAEDADYRHDRFGVTVLSQRPAAWQGDQGFAEYTNIILTEPIPRSELGYIPADSPLSDSAKLEDGLPPGIVGFITSVDYAGTDREVLAVSFRDANGRWLARADLSPRQCRPATPSDRSKHSSAAKAAVAD